MALPFKGAALLPPSSTIGNGSIDRENKQPQPEGESQKQQRAAGAVESLEPMQNGVEAGTTHAPDCHEFGPRTGSATRCDSGRTRNSHSYC